MAPRGRTTNPPIVRSPRRPEVPEGSGAIDAERLVALREQVLSTTDPDRQLDADLAEAFGHGTLLVMGNYTMDMHPAIRWSAPHVYAGMVEPCPSFTASVDAVMELAHNTPGVDPLAVFLAASGELEREMVPMEQSRRPLVRAVLPRVLVSHLIDAAVFAARPDPAS